MTSDCDLSASSDVHRYVGCVGLMGFTPTSPGGVIGTCSTPPDLVWISALVVAVSAILVCLLGNALARYHEHRVSHTRRLRPSAWLFVYATLLCARCE